MAAEIIQFPKKITKPDQKYYKSVDLYYCWDSKLNNPFLNSIFKTQTPYAERWYLEVVHLLNLEKTNHPIITTLLSKDDNTLDLLLDRCEKDLVVQRYFAEKSTLYVTQPQTAKLTRWIAKWKSLQQLRHRLYSS